MDAPVNIWMGLLTQRPSQPYNVFYFKEPNFLGYARVQGIPLSSGPLEDEVTSYGSWKFTFNNLGTVVDGIVGYFLFSTLEAAPRLLSVSPVPAGQSSIPNGLTTFNITYAPQIPVV